MPADSFSSVLVVGPPFSGKTALIKHVLYQQALEEYEPTLGLMPHRLQGKVGDKDVTCTLWDTGGDARNREIRRAYYATAAVVIIVTDVTRQRSILEARLFYNEVIANSQRDATVILVGTKSDLNKEQYEDDLIRLSNEWHASCYLISVKNEKQVQALFSEVLNEVYAKSNQRKSMAIRSADSKRKEVFGSKIDRSAKFIMGDSKAAEPVEVEAPTEAAVITATPQKSYFRRHGFKILLGALVFASLLFSIFVISGGLGALSLLITGTLIMSKAGADALLTVVTILLGAGIGAGMGAFAARFHKSDKKDEIVKADTSKADTEESTEKITKTLLKTPSKVKAAALAYEESLQTQAKPEPKPVPSASVSEVSQTSAPRVGRRISG